MKALKLLITTLFTIGFLGGTGLLLSACDESGSAPKSLEPLPSSPQPPVSPAPMKTTEPIPTTEPEPVDSDTLEPVIPEDESEATEPAESAEEEPEAESPTTGESGD